MHSREHKLGEGNRLEDKSRICITAGEGKEPGAFKSAFQKPDTHLQGTILIIYKTWVVGEGEKVILQGGNSINKGRRMVWGMT